jgi:hypothetical protein
MFPVSLAPCLGIAAKMKVPNKKVPLAGHFRFSTPHPNHLRRPAHRRYANEANNSITVPIGVRRTAQQWGCPAAARPSQPSLIISTHHSILTCIPECHGSAQNVLLQVYRTEDSSGAGGEKKSGRDSPCNWVQLQKERPHHPLVSETGSPMERLPCVLG